MADQIVRLQSSWSYYPGADGVLELACIPLGKRLSLRGAGATGRALDALATGIGAPETGRALAAASGISVAQAESLLARLDDLGALVRRNRSDDVTALDGGTLYDRQIRFLSFYE